MAEVALNTVFFLLAFRLVPGMVISSQPFSLRYISSMPAPSRSQKVSSTQSLNRAVSFDAFLWLNLTDETPLEKLVDSQQAASPVQSGSSQSTRPSPSSSRPLLQISGTTAQTGSPAQSGVVTIHKTIAVVVYAVGAVLGCRGIKCCRAVFIRIHCHLSV